MLYKCNRAVQLPSTGRQWKDPGGDTCPKNKQVELRSDNMWINCDLNDRGTLQTYYIFVVSSFFSHQIKAWDNGPFFPHEGISWNPFVWTWGAVLSSVITDKFMRGFFVLLQT